MYYFQKKFYLLKSNSIIKKFGLYFYLCDKIDISGAFKIIFRWFELSNISRSFNINIGPPCPHSPWVHRMQKCTSIGEKGIFHKISFTHSPIVLHFLTELNVGLLCF